MKSSPITLSDDEGHTGGRDYEELKAGRGSRRARIAMIRRLCGIMCRMLLQGEQFHWLKEELYRRKRSEHRGSWGIDGAV